APLALTARRPGRRAKERCPAQSRDCSAARLEEIAEAMTEAEFRALAAQGYNRIPLVLESFADLDTPLSLYVKLANEPFTFLLESVVGGERFGRYSFIGLPAATRISARGESVEVSDGAA